MKHPEILLLPALMLANYFLAVWGAIKREKNYSHHFKTQHCTLNPIWQKQIRQKKWFNPRHIFFTIIPIAILACCLESDLIPDDFISGIMGCLFIVYSTTIGRNLSHLMIYRYLAKNPYEITGEISMSHSFVLSLSTYQYLEMLLPIAIIAIFSPTPFVFGGLCGTILIFVLQFVWIFRNKKSIEKNKTN
jgi:hypothetical protein